MTAVDAAAAAATGSFRRQARLLRYAKPHWRGLAVLVATMVANIGLDLLRPWPLKLLVDNVLGDHRVPSLLRSLPGVDGRHGLLLWVVLGTLLIFLLGTVTHMIYTYASLRLGQRMTWSLAADLFAHLQRLSVLFHTRRPVGDLLSRVTGDSWCVNTLVADALVPALRSLITLVAMFVVMWNLQPTLTLLALGVAPFFVIVIKVLGGPLKDRSREQLDLEGSMMSIVEQSLSAVPAVQAFSREEHEVRRFRSFADRTTIAYVRATVAGLWFELFAGLVTTLGTAAVIYVGADLALRGELTTGTIIVFISYLSSLYDPLDAITHTTQTVQGAAAEADRVSEILETEPAIRDRRHAREAKVTGPIRYEHVTFGYEPGRPVLQDVTLEATPGDVVAIVGATGAGKTTLMNLLLRFFDPWSGRITIDGVDLRDMRHRSLRRQIAMVLQDPFIFPLTIAENIAYGRPDASRAHVERAARAAGAHDFITRLPDGYDAVVGERGATLSGGEKQRLSIARAFLKDSPVLILDEPTASLDAHTEAALLQALDRLMAGRISFVIAHRLSTIRAATRILVLDHGRIAESGTHDELLEADGLYASLYRRQLDLADHDAARERRTPPSAGSLGARRSLRIAQLAPVAMPVRPGEGDSIEQLVALLTDELVRRGHDVTLYATGDSVTSARLRSVRRTGYHEDAELWDWQFSEMLHAALPFEHAADHDLIHAHDYHFALPFAGAVDVPLIETPHVESAPAVVEAYRRLPHVHVAAVSEHQRRALGGGANISVVQHGIDVEAFPFAARGGDYLLFLGRMLPNKGPLEAIRIAEAAGMPLVLAGRTVEGAELDLDPWLDGDRIRYVGHVDHGERNRLLAGAAALVFPAVYPEPFGLVLVEAMACGTPVVATATGAVREIVEDGVTGLTAPTWEGLVPLVARAAALDRGAVRREAERRYDFRRMVDDYEELYHRVLDSRAARR